MPRPLLDSLSATVDRLVSANLPGDRRASGIGLGIELAQLRPYEVGDDLRHLDPAATARTGQPHVRLHVPDRALTTWIVLDLSPSMGFGTSRRLKADVAEGVAGAFARLGVRRAGSVGLLAFGAGGILVLAPRGARPGVAAVRRLLEEGIAEDGLSDPDGLADALRRTGRLARQPGLVVVISDFRDQRAWEGALGPLRTRHATLAVEIHDPRESQLPAAGRLVLEDPESGAQIEVDSSNAALRRRFAELEVQRRESLATELRRLRVAHVALSTDGEWLRELGAALR